MQCNFYTHSFFDERSVHKNANRVTLSKLTDMNVQQYTAPTYGIKYVLQGTEHYKIGNRRYPVSAGNYLLVNPDQPIDFHLHSKTEIIGVCIHLHADMVLGVYNDLTKTDQQLLDNPRIEGHLPSVEPIIFNDQENNFGKYLHQFQKNLNKNDGSHEMEDQEFYYNAGAQMLQLQKMQIPSCRFLRSTTQQELIRRLEIGKAYIDDHGLHAVEIPDAANAAMLSPAHFYRSFKKVYGTSPYNYVLQRRMKLAASLLEKNIPTDVALQCGFPDLASFSKAFKKMYRIAPSVYRKIQTT